MEKQKEVCKECNGTGLIENNQGRYIPPDQALFIADGYRLMGYECLACKPKSDKP